MKALLAIASASLLTMPVQSNELRSSMEDFCQTVREANMANIPMYPESPMARRIEAQTQTSMPYAQLWAFAKAANIPSCNEMW